MITKNYIKMCEKADEIQKAWKPKNFDRYILENEKKYDEDAILYACIDDDLELDYDTKDKIYLPTQEQLQEMMSKEFGTVLLISDFYNFAIENLLPFDSMNELWLAFVMHEKYHKIWTGKDWK